FAAVLAAAVWIPLLAGCVSSRNTAGGEDPGALIERRLQALETRTLELEDMCAALKRDQLFLEQQVEGIGRQTGEVSRERDQAMAEIRSSVEALKQATEQRLQIVLEEVSRENARLRAEIAKGGSRTGGRGGYMRGYEHVVASGETVSTIARTYNSTVEAIVEANGLGDPNSIRVGQNLFVPAP
ncbi:MAG TPA: LysM domain-containing protein, partial [bacterium]|nr:LysM domain-containing protein [bacterium]